MPACGPMKMLLCESNRAFELVPEKTGKEVSLEELKRCPARLRRLHAKVRLGANCGAEHSAQQLRGFGGARLRRHIQASRPSVIREVGGLDLLFL